MAKNIRGGNQATTSLTTLYSLYFGYINYVRNTGFFV